MPSQSTTYPGPKRSRDQQQVVDFLTLERLEENIFRGESRNLGTPQVYGGQVLGQSLEAAQLTVDGRDAHSIHAYFLRRGDFNAPIIYQVDRSRDGGSFASRRVVAIQHGKPIFTMSASFQRPEDGLEYYESATAIPPTPKEEPRVESSDYTHLNEAISKTDFGFCITLADSYEVSRKEENRNRWWIKTREKMNDDAAKHKSVLAYISDGGILNTAVKPHGYHPMEVKRLNNEMLLASLDHSIWYHRPFRADEWLLYDTKAISSSNGRGLARASFYDIQGRLVATCMQEGVTRRKK